MNVFCRFLTFIDIDLLSFEPKIGTLLTSALTHKANFGGFKVLFVFELGARAVQDR